MPIILESCPHLRLLVTSRERLCLDEEKVIRLRRLSTLPREGPAGPSFESILAVDAVHLFVDRVQSKWPDFVVSRERLDSIVEICSVVEGLPLAIELAAGRMGVLSAEEISARIGQSLSGLNSIEHDRPSRHQTMEASIDWSVDLLSEFERRFLEDLTILATSFSLGAAEAIGETIVRQSIEAGNPDDSSARILESLVSLKEKSLIYTIDSNSNRSDRFQVPVQIKMYLATRVYSNQRDGRILGRLASFYESSLSSQDNPTPGNSRSWYAEMDLDYPNLKLVMKWLGRECRYDELIHLFHSLNPYWYSRMCTDWELDCVLPEKECDFSALILSEGFESSGGQAFEYSDVRKALFKAHTVVRVRASNRTSAPGSPSGQPALVSWPDVKPSAAWLVFR